MDNNEALQTLQNLREKIIEYGFTKIEMEKCRDALSRARTRRPVAVEDFDASKKDAFIQSQIGPKPEKPKGIVRFAIPVFRVKMKEYEKENADYKARFEKLEQAYYDVYALQRAKIEEDEEKEIANSIQAAEADFEEAKAKFSSAERELNEDHFLSEKYKRISVIDQLIGYFEDDRVDSIREAINLYYEDEHRRKLEEIAKEQLQRIEEAKAYAKQAADSANAAAYSADEAVSKAESAMFRVEEAYSKAEEAYSKAEEAYDQAQSAYWAAQNDI